MAFDGGRAQIMGFLGLGCFNIRATIGGVPEKILAKAGKVPKDRKTA